MRTVIFIAVLCSVISIRAAENMPSPFRIIPQPRSVKILDGKGLESDGLGSLVIDNSLKRPVLPPVLDSMPLHISSNAGVLSLQLIDKLPFTDSPEGYLLEILNGSASIKATAAAGIYYGCQTLAQLIEDAGENGVSIPACHIEDYPALPYRAVHIDVKHHLDHLKYYYDSIDRLAKYKINAIIFEFEDKLRYVRQPLVGMSTAISIDEMAALTRYALERNIEISPLVQGLGHASFILKHKHYLPLREEADSPWVFCPLNDETYKVLFDMYLDAMDATPGSRYLHVGGDEIKKIGVCPRCKPMADRDGVLGLNLYWLNRVCDFAERHGRIPIFWDDMPLNHAGLWHNVREYKLQTEEMTNEAWEKGQPVLDKMIERFPQKCIYMRWTYNLGRGPGNIRALNWYRERGLKVFVATAAQNVSALLPQDDRVNIIQSFVSLAAERGMEGMLCTAWDDWSPHMETYWRGLAASAEYSWSPHGRTLEEYEPAWLRRAFGPECINMTSLYSDLFKSVELWTTGFIKKGTRASPELQLINLPDPEKPGKWSSEYSGLIKKAHEESERYGKTSDQLTEMLAVARRNRFHIQLLAAINNFQNTTASLLIALEKCDTADSEKRKCGFDEVSLVLNGFNQVWNELEEVYSRTRFLSYPADYVPDRYFHLASQSEDQEWLIRMEKQLHRDIRLWMEKAGMKQ